ncbi:MAG: hypothetical protein ACYTG0_38820 [Planctomycetota bacterium]
MKGEIERLEHIAEADGFASARLRWGQGQELPDPVGVSLAPRPVGDEAQLKQALQGLIDLLTTHAQSLGHAFSAVERGAVSIGSQSQ